MGMDSTELGYYTTPEAASMLDIAMCTMYELNGLIRSKSAGIGEARGAGRLWLIDDLVLMRHVASEAQLSPLAAGRVVKALRENRI